MISSYPLSFFGSLFLVTLITVILFEVGPDFVSFDAAGPEDEGVLVVSDDVVVVCFPDSGTDLYAAMVSTVRDRLYGGVVESESASSEIGENEEGGDPDPPQELPRFLFLEKAEVEILLVNSVESLDFCEVAEVAEVAEVVSDVVSADKEDVVDDL